MCSCHLQKEASNVHSFQTGQLESATHEWTTEESLSEGELKHPGFSSLHALVRPNKNGGQVRSEFLEQLHQLLCRESVDFTLHMRVVSKEATKIKIKDLAVLLCLAREVSCLSQLDLQLRKA